MKATGIVRRIDDLGRVVIPKEIRKTMRLRNGTSGSEYRETAVCVVQAAVCVIILSDCMSVFRFALFRQIMLCHFADNTGGILTEYRIVLHHANAAAERT